MKKILSVILTIACVFTMGISLVACDLFGNKDEAAAFVSMDINPSIEFTLDKNNKVISVYGANEDGQVLLYGEEGIVGADIEVATAKILDLAKQLGYVNEDNTVVQTTVTSNTSIKDTSITNKINAQVTASAEKLGIQLKCEANDAYSLMRQLEQLKAQYPNSAAVQNLTPAKLKLVISATESGEISVEAAAEMDTSKLVNYVSNAHKDLEEYATKAYQQAKSAASLAYDEAVSVATDGVYSAYYLESVLRGKHLNTAYYGAMYQAYRTAGRAINVAANALTYIEKINDYALNQTQIQSVLTAFGTDVTVKDLQDSKGDVTINSIYAYADKMFKNSEAADQLNEIKSKLDSALNAIDSELQVKIAEAAEKYQPQIQAISDGINSIVDALPEIVKNAAKVAFDELADAANSIVAILEDGKITSDEVRDLAIKMNDKADKVLADIEKDLSKEELAEIAETKETLMNKAAAAKAQMEQAIAQAEETAKARLAELKASRTSK